MAPSAIDVASSEEVRALLKAKKKKETATIEEEAREKAALDKADAIRDMMRRKKEAIHASILKRREERREAVRVRNQRRQEQGSITIDVAGRVEEERLARIALLETKEANVGVWKRGGRGRWSFDRGVSATKAAQANVLDEAGAILTDTKGSEYRGLLQRRWRSMTGLELTPAHPVMQPKASQLALQDLASEENASKPLDLPTTYRPG